MDTSSATIILNMMVLLMTSVVPTVQSWLIFKEIKGGSRRDN